MKLQSRSGFSLVELMVVVAIIGILATIAVPNFQRFTARAKQANAKTELTGIFTAQKAFFTEYNSYHAHLPMTGYVPEGVNVAAGGNYDALDRARIYATGMGVGAGNTALANVGGTSGFPPAPLDPAGAALAYSGVFGAHGDGCSGATDVAILAQGGAIVAATDAVFQAKAVGCPKSGNQPAAAMDVWRIDHTRAIVNVRSGI